MASSIGLGTINFSGVFHNLKPDLVLVIGDRFDVLPAVIAAAAMNIPIAHTMGGERTGTIDESIRHAITKFSNIHFPANSDAANRIERLGESPSTIHEVGCPRIDYVAECVRGFEEGKRLSSEALFDQYGGVGATFDIEAEPFVLVSYHPVTTEYGRNGDHVRQLLLALHDFQHKAILIWPNADAGSDETSKEIRKFREEYSPDWMHLFVNLPIEVYLQLMWQCCCMVGNSSSAIREGAIRCSRSKHGNTARLTSTWRKYHRRK